MTAAERDECEAVQRALIEGVRDEAVQAHVAECSACRFFGEMSRELGGAASGASSARTPPPGGVLEALLETLQAGGQPLLSRYRLEERLGHGGQGVVYRALDAETGETVAVKLAPSDPQASSAAAQEVVLAHRVQHRNVCRVYHTERHGNLRLIVMELVEGRSLRAALAGLSAKERCSVFEGVCAGVHAAHEAGVLHLDLKPANVLLRRDLTPVVTDFGLSVGMEDGQPARRRGGTWDYMAPEQREDRPLDRRADVYSLGVILRELFPEPPRFLRRVIRRATCDDPAGRYPDVRALATDVHLPSRRRRRIRRVAAVSALPCLVALLALALPPAGRRAAWRADGKWGPDPVPPAAWNVAVNQAGRGLPSVEPDHPPIGCARNPWQLVDGIAQYHEWERGYAFHGPAPICVALGALGYCGALRPDAQLCRLSESGASLLGIPVKDQQRVRPEDRPGLGQLEEAGGCDHDDHVTITLDRPRSVVAVRSWYHSGIPRALAVELETARGWQTPFATMLNTQQRVGQAFPEGYAGGSVPVTTLITPPVVARRVRLAVRCNARQVKDPSQVGEPVWLYEIEVLAPLGRLEAWGRLLGRR